MKPNQTDLVGEYLHEVDLRLSGLPLLQRRELLADLAAHIATERTDRDVRSEAELIEILERLGSPEVVAAAAYEEAGAGTPRTASVPPPFVAPPPFAAPSFAAPPPAPRTARPPRLLWLFGALAAVGVMLVLCLAGALMVSRSTQDSPPAVTTPVQATPATPTTPSTP
ncbi:hypothetical protein ACWT_0410 [Actinoplanes sp. SE50]|uniref:HAAS signaling domain-containing protein n=1 Tax=unclassified Actinoplanes TaxID=2626549 RepID=UPI00023EC6EC|nr:MULTISPECIES: hypothetical protein [unclassified Actinoplanes]AEV81422.1 hypothetical protein ACPL_525 [Actinoplanes sp. SE50/110]ATO79825.1 hypothetical protein ACWT_0410 [Actinoplanes sp. SE50]SLL97227.1 uncharacterized protein ACSP50_0425 [Actinoplanes sp. SE50/110]